MESIFVVGAVALIVGMLIGWGISRASGTTNVRQRRLAQQLDSLQNEHTRYQAQVNEHFMETAEMIRRLNDSYRDLHQHLARGASRLCSEGDAREELEQARQDNQLAYQREDDDVEPPRDYAPKGGPDDKGTLSEEYGLEDSESREEETRQKA